jgi:hypothetical protein
MYVKFVILLLREVLKHELEIADRAKRSIYFRNSKGLQYEKSQFL